MKDAGMKHIKRLLVAASVVAAAPAWSQASGGAKVDNAVLDRIEALTRELEQLKVQVKTNEEKANKAEEHVKALATQTSAQFTDLTGKISPEPGSVAGDPEGVEVLKSNKASLKFYGMIDAGVEKVTLDRPADGKSEGGTRVSNGMITPHFGVRGAGRVTDGLQASFNLEGSFASDNGTSGIGGRLFGRQSWVGLSGAFGTVRLGRQYTAVRLGWEDANPYGTGNQGLRLLDPRISNPRADNSLSYIFTVGSFTISANRSWGWDAVNGNSANTGPANNGGAYCVGEVPDDNLRCREWSVGAKYAGKNWGVAASFEELRGGVKGTSTATTYGGLTSPDLTDKRTVLGGYLKLKDAKLAAGWIKRENEGSAATPKSDLIWTEAIVPLGGPWYVDGVLARLKYKDSSDKATLVNLRGRYVLNSDTTLYLTVANMDNDGSLALPATASTPAPTPKAGTSETSAIVGVLYKF